MATDFFEQLAACLALDDGCEGLGGEWETSGLCGIRGWDVQNSSTLELRRRLMDF
jgi:hypothetical protein